MYASQNRLSLILICCNINLFFIAPRIYRLCKYSYIALHVFGAGELN